VVCLGYLGHLEGDLIQKEAKSLGEVGLPHMSMKTIKTRLFESSRTTFDGGI
jgi:hypothetical protein